MQQINSVGAINQSQNINYKKDDKNSEVKENSNQIPDGTKKLGLALAALGVAAIAGVAIYKKNSSKAKDIIQQTTKEVVQDSQKEANLAKNVRQGMKNATSAEVVEAKIETAKNAASKAQENAKKLEPLKNGTHKEKISAQRASNQAAIAQKEANITQQKGEQKIAELKRQAELKAKHIEEYKASPNYELGQQKMQENAKKTQENAAKRLSQKETQKAQKKFMGKNSNQLKVIYNNGSYNNIALSEVEKKTIADILAKKGIV